MDSEFVVENNAIQVYIETQHNESLLFSIQRNLIIYLLEHALYKCTSIETNGKILISNYYNSCLNKDFETAKNALLKNEGIDVKQLLPKWLVNFHFPPNNINNLTKNPFEKILNEAIDHEKRYALLLRNAQNLGLESEFIRKNKGQQFKLRFVKKAWNLMYFKAIYKEEQEAIHNHHKSLHINKYEFKNFCRWVFGANNVPEYKKHLRELFGQKKFLNNTSFSTLFEKGTNLNN